MDKLDKWLWHLRKLICKVGDAIGLDWHIDWVPGTAWYADEGKTEKIAHRVKTCVHCLKDEAR